MIEYKVKVYDNRTEWFNLNNQRHREAGPALEYEDGTKVWYLNGKRHREDGPAIESTNGSKFWYLNGNILTEKEFNQRTKPSCSGKVVEIDGKKYKLIEL